MQINKISLPTYMRYLLDDRACVCKGEREKDQGTTDGPRQDPFVPWTERFPSLFTQHTAASTCTRSKVKEKVHKYPHE